MKEICIVGYGIDTVFCWDRFNKEKCKSFLEANKGNYRYESIDDFIEDIGLAGVFCKCDESGQLSYARTEYSEYLFLESLLPWEVGGNKDYNKLTVETVKKYIVDAIQTLTDIPEDEIIFRCMPINDIEDY